ncbi:MAG: glycerol-3-phosphate 1-O-acyltransferase PlsY [Bacteroidia bacterium]
MDYLEILFYTLVAYVIGSIPTSIWLGRFRYGIDIREHGYGNASHTNVHHVLGPRAGLFVQAFDVLKGFVAARLALYVHHTYGIFTEMEYPLLMLSFGLAATLGHILPVFAGFRGGKGYHVVLGVLVAVHPIATLIFTACSLLIYLIFRYPHLAYVAGALALSVATLWQGNRLFGDLRLPMLVFGMSTSLMLFFTHREEIRGLFAHYLQPIQRPYRRVR